MGMRVYEFLLEGGDMQRVLRFEGPLHEAARKAVRVALREAKTRGVKIVVSVKSLVNIRIAEIDCTRAA